MATTPMLAAGPAPTERIPPLRHGDRLTRAEFERRYEAMPDLKKAELLEGVVYVPSPVSLLEHGQPHFRVIGWLNQYCDATPGVDGGDNTTLRLDLENEPQPDAFLMVLPECGGQARVEDEGYMAAAPELVVEVAASSASYDLGVKMRVYQRAGVREYVVWRVRNGAVDWFVLREDGYEPLEPDAAGLYRSEVFPGLWLDAAALIHGDRAGVNEALRAGLAAPEHAAFLARLEAAVR
jgi:Uma2 family endonuclease